MNWWTVFVILFLFGFLFGGDRTSSRTQDFGDGGESYDGGDSQDPDGCNFWEEDCDFFDEGD